MRSRDWASVVLGVLGVAGVVTITTAGPDTLPARLTLEGAWLHGVRLAGVALAAVGLTVLLRGGGATGATLRTTATIMGVLAVLAITTRPPAPDPRPDRPTPTASLGWIELQALGGGGAATPSRSRGGTSPIVGGRIGGGGSGSGEPEATPSPGSGQPGLLGRASRYLGPLLVLLVIAAVISRMRARRPPPIPDDPPFELSVPPRIALAGIAGTLDSPVWERGAPGDQITAAYHRLLSALASAGADRRPCEAPHEHLYRALGPLGVRPEPLHRLAGLYVLAQFGTARITEDHRAGARRALEESLSSLRDAEPDGS